MSKYVNLLYFTYKNLTQSPAFVASIVITLGLTLSALIIAFNVNYLMYLKPLPYGDDSTIYNISRTNIVEGEERQGGGTYPGVMHMFKHQKVLRDATPVTMSIEVATSFAGHPQVNSLFTTHDFFDLFAVDMALGRKFDEHINVDPTAAVAVLSYSAWMNYYSGDSNVLDQKIVINDVSFSIIGVIAKDFSQPEFFGGGIKADLILPWDFNATLPTKRDRWDYGTGDWQLLGRLKEDTDITFADHNISELLRVAFSNSEPGRTFFKGDIAGVELVPLQEFLRGGGDAEDAVSYILAGAIALIIIATTNLINLFLSRAAEKQRNLSLRVALGAKKIDIFRMLLAESGLLMMAAFVFAVFIAYLGMSMIKVYAYSYIPRSDELGFSLETLALSLLVCILFSFFFAGVSSHLIKYRQLQATLQSSGKGSGLQISKRVRFFLVACQIFVVTVILAINTNIFDSGMRTLAQPLSFKSENLYVLQLTNSTTSLTHEEITEKIYTIKDMLNKNIVGMNGISATFNNPITTRFGVGVNIENSDDGAVGANAARIDQDTLDVLDLPLMSGRNFTADEIRNHTKVVLIGQALATRLYPNEDAIGKNAYFHWDAEPSRIVGIVKDMTVYSADRQPFDIYSTFRFDIFRYLMRFEQGSVPTREQINTILKNHGIDHKVFEFEPMSTYLSDEIKHNIFISAFVLALSLIAIVLAGLGIYGVLNYSIALRKFELGVRMAIGAKARDIIVLVVKDEGRPVLAGLFFSACLVLVFFIAARQYYESLDSLSILPILVTLISVLLTVALSIFMPLYRLLRLWPEKLLKRQD